MSFNSRDPFAERAAAMKEIVERREKTVELESAGIQDAESGVAAEANFRTNYSRVAEDPDLMNIAGKMDALLVSGGDQRRPWDRMQDVGDRLSEACRNPRQLHGLKTAAQEGRATDAASDLLRFSRSGDGDADAHDAVERMRAARGR